MTTPETKKPDLSAVKVNFPEPEDMGAREWGTETLVAYAPGKYSMKYMFVKAGANGGLQYHHLKDEAGYLISGEMIVRFDDGKGGLEEKIIKAGDAYHFPPGSVHQSEAITDCKLFEASTPHFNDRVRVEEHYGLPTGGGLPSTTLEEVEER